MHTCTHMHACMHTHTHTRTHTHAQAELCMEADKVSKIQTTLEEGIAKIKKEEDTLATKVYTSNNTYLKMHATRSISKQ